MSSTFADHDETALFIEKEGRPDEERLQHTATTGDESKYIGKDCQIDLTRSQSQYIVYETPVSSELPDDHANLEARTYYKKFIASDAPQSAAFAITTKLSKEKKKKIHTSSNSETFTQSSLPLPSVESEFTNTAELLPTVTTNEFSSKDQGTTLTYHSKLNEPHESSIIGVGESKLSGPHATSKVSPYWLSFFAAGAPYRVLLPASVICHVVGKGGKTVNQVSQVTSASIQIIRDNPITNLDDQIVLISGPTAEAQQAGLGAILHQLYSKTKHFLVDKEGHTAVVILVPERAVSVLLGVDGKTMKAIESDFDCNIQVFPITKQLTCHGHADRVLSVRGKDISLIVSSIAKIHEILSDMLLKHKLTETDFIFSLRLQQHTQAQQTLAPPQPIGHQAGLMKLYYTP